MKLNQKKTRVSKCMKFPSMWYVRPAKPQISLRIRAVWSEHLLVAWVFYECYATDWTPFGVSKLKRRLQRLLRVYTCQNVKFLEISCCGSGFFHSMMSQLTRLRYLLSYSFNMHAQLSRNARGLKFSLSLNLRPYVVCASCECSD